MSIINFRMNLCTLLLLLSFVLTTAVSGSAIVARPASSSSSSVGQRKSLSSVPTKASSATMEGLKASLASALAAACSKTLLAPFDTLKTVQQHYRVSSGEALSFWKASQLIMSRPKGVLEFYAGLGVSVVGSMPSVGLYFGVYSYCKRVLQPLLDTKFGPSSSYNINSRLLFSLSVTSSAAIGNTIASFSRVPYEVVKQKLQTGVYAGTWEALTHMARDGGVRAFFPLGGVGIQMLRDIPYAMVTLLCYEMLKESVVTRRLKEDGVDKVVVDAFTGAMAGGIGSYVTNPMDVIKTRLQTDPALYQGSIATCAMATWKEGGSMAFLRGSVPRLLHKVPANGCFFLFYEFFRTVLKVESSSSSSK